MTDGMEHVDVIVVGAGISGIGLAAHLLRAELPTASLAVLDARDATGGTWDLFRYPGVRSDSDLHTYGYEFAPWRDRTTIAAGAPILRYLRETARETGVQDHIRLRHRVVAAAWSSTQQRWTVEIDRDGERLHMSCWWLVFATGYYAYDAGHTPDLPGLESFTGPVVHPQHWPEDLDHTGRRVVIIGSGATAVTLVPAMARDAALVTMLQRTPTYVVSLASRSELVTRLPALIGEERAYRLTRWVFATRQRASYAFCRRFPRLARRVIRRGIAAQLPDGFDMAHFDPPYDPWDQRLCIVPDGDLFSSLSDGSAAIVTDRIDRITPDGVALAGGGHLDADILVTATGFTLLPFGGIEVSVDGIPVVLPETVTYKGVMLSGVPNLCFAIGYTHASWTLKIGPIGDHLTRLLGFMLQQHHGACMPVLPEEEMTTRPLLDLDAGYVRRSVDALPRQGDRAPWLMATEVEVDVRVLREGPITDPHLRFTAERTTS